MPDRLLWELVVDARRDVDEPAMLLTMMDLRAISRVPRELADARLTELFSALSVNHGYFAPAHFADLGFELMLHRYIATLASTDGRVVCGSFALHRLLKSVGPEPDWSPDDLDVMTRGAHEHDDAVQETREFFELAGCHVVERVEVSNVSIATAYSLEAPRYTLDLEHVRIEIDRWCDSESGVAEHPLFFAPAKTGSPYLPHMEELRKVGDHLPAELTKREWLVAVESAPGEDEEEEGHHRRAISTKLVCSTTDGRDFTVNVVAYAYAPEAWLRQGVVPRTCPYKPITELVEQFDLTPCAVTMRVHPQTGRPTFGGSGNTLVRNQVANRQFRLEIKPYAFSQLTGMHPQASDDAHLAIIDGVAVYGEDLVQGEDSQVQSAKLFRSVERQMQRIAKYVARGFVL